MKRLILAISILLFSVPALAVPVDIEFAFTASVSTDVVGYTLHMRSASGTTFDTVWDMKGFTCADTECSFILVAAEIPYGEYVFAMKAFDDQLNESDLSNETEIFRIVEPDTDPPLPPTDVRTILQKIIAWFLNFLNGLKG